MIVVRRLAKFNTGGGGSLSGVPVSDGAHLGGIQAATFDKVVAERFRERAFAGQPDKVILLRQPDAIQLGN